MITFLAVTLPGFLVSFASSVILHPIIYRRDATRFSQIRLGPGIGVALVVVNSVVKLYLLCHWISDWQRRDKLEVHLFSVLAHLWAAAEVMVGVFSADLYRAARRK